MNHYKLIIEKWEDNEKFDEQMKQFNDERRYPMNYGGNTAPEKSLITNHLTIVLNEEQMDAVKKAALEQFS